MKKKSIKERTSDSAFQNCVSKTQIIEENLCSNQNISEAIEGIFKINIVFYSFSQQYLFAIFAFRTL